MAKHSFAVAFHMCSLRPERGSLVQLTYPRLVATAVEDQLTICRLLQRKCAAHLLCETFGNQPDQAALSFVE
jgi:hypothetical protein